MRFGSWDVCAADKLALQSVVGRLGFLDRLLTKSSVDGTALVCGMLGAF